MSKKYDRLVIFSHKNFKKLVQMFDQLFLWRENYFIATGLFLALVKQRAASEALWGFNAFGASSFDDMFPENANRGSIWRDNGFHGFG